MSEDERKVVNNAIGLYLNAAKKAEDSAGFAGRTDDGGASSMRSNIKVYQCGLNQQVPDFLKPYMETAILQSDPEWNEYQRLQDCCLHERRNQN